MRLWLRGLGLTVVCVAAVVASFSALASLAAFTGWGAWESWLLPLTLDALGMTACLVWLDTAAPKKARRYAAWLTWTAASLSILGNGASHLAATGHLRQGLLLVVLVGSIPPAAVSTVVHLIVLVSAPGKVTARSSTPARDTAPAPAAKPALPSPSAPGNAPALTSSRSQVKVRSKPPVEVKAEVKVDEVELQRARHADRDFRAANEDRPITRPALKAALGIGTDKAAALLAALKKETEAA